TPPRPCTRSSCAHSHPHLCGGRRRESRPGEALVTSLRQRPSTITGTCFRTGSTTWRRRSVLAGRLHSERRRDPCRLKPSGPNPVQVPETTNGDPRRESPSSRLTCCYSLWSHGESNPRPLVCKTSALPTELWPLGPGYENPGHQAE